MSLKKVFALVLTLAMVLSLAACGGKEEKPAETPAETPAEAPAEEESGKIQVGFVSAAFSDEWCHNLAMAMQDMAGTEYPEIEATVLDGNIDPATQINAIQALLQQGIDYLAIQPMPGAEPGMIEAMNAGVPVICVDMVPTSDELVWTQVGVDEAEFGRLQAAALAEVLPENGTVGLAMNQMGSNSQINRTAGFEEKIAELRPDVQIIDKQPVDSKTDKAMNLVEDWLQRFGADGINAIVCQSAMGVQGVVESLKAHDLVGKIYVAAQDFTQPSGTEWLKSGATIVDVFYDYNALTRGTYDAIMDHQSGTELPEQIMIAPSVWTIDNCEEFGK